MSFRGRGRGRGGGRGGGGRQYDEGPPDTVVKIGKMLNACEGDLVLRADNDMVPYFNAPIYLENKEQVGKIDEIFGPINEYMMSVKLQPNMSADSFKRKQPFYINPMKLLPMSRFLPKPPAPKVKRVGGAGGGRGGGRGGARGRGGGRGRGAPRGGRGRGGGGGFRGGRGRF